MFLDQDKFFTRAQTAEALTQEGFKVSPATLATKATRGGGPPYRLFGRRPLYRWGDALEWARGRLSEPVTCTAEAAAASANARHQDHNGHCVMSARETKGTPDEDFVIAR
jgi:hypothetical protein